MRPYYEHAGIVIYHADCRDVLDQLTADVLLTDPPYGVSLGTSDPRGDGHGLARAGYRSFSDTPDVWTDLVPPVVTRALSFVKRGALFPGPQIATLPNPAAVGGVYCPIGHGRNAWGFTTLMPVFFYGVNPRLQQGAQWPLCIRSVEGRTANGHPCPKPYGWMAWLVNLVSLCDEVILDPFAGSGTTLVAAKNLGRRAIGIEIDERYCEIAAESLSQEVLPFAPTSSTVVQSELFEATA